MKDVEVNIYPNNITVDFENKGSRKIIGSMSIDICEGYGFVRLLRAGGGVMKHLNSELLEELVSYYPFKELKFLMEEATFKALWKITDVKLEFVEKTIVEGKEAFLVKVKTNSSK